MPCWQVDGTLVYQQNPGTATFHCRTYQAQETCWAWISWMPVVILVKWSLQKQRCVVTIFLGFSITEDILILVGGHFALFGWWTCVVKRGKVLAEMLCLFLVPDYCILPILYRSWVCPLHFPAKIFTESHTLFPSSQAQSRACFWQFFPFGLIDFGICFFFLYLIFDSIMDVF